MQIVLDTNVLMSGIFWSGAPSFILEAWMQHRLELVITTDILEEYLRVAEILNQKYPKVNAKPIIELIAVKSKLYCPVPLKQPISRDPDDDKFIAACLASNCHLIVSGDKDLLDISEFQKIKIYKPAKFVTDYLSRITLPRDN
jgi:putative PIN family toxin of toxin-antitoxin system